MGRNPHLCDEHGRGARMLDVLSMAGVDVVRAALGDLDIPDIDWDRSTVLHVSLFERDVQSDATPCDDGRTSGGS